MSEAHSQLETTAGRSSEECFDFFEIFLREEFGCHSQEINVCIPFPLFKFWHWSKWPTGQVPGNFSRVTPTK